MWMGILLASARDDPQRSSRSSHKEDDMSAKRVFTTGFLSMIAATGLFAASNSLAAQAHRVDVVESASETVVQLDSMKAKGEETRVDVIGSIGSEGPAYPYTKPMSH